MKPKHEQRIEPGSKKANRPSSFLKFKASNPAIIRRVRDPWGWMGNMAPFPIEHEGTAYRTTEALFQCLRFPTGHPVREEIRACESPMRAKLTATAVKSKMSLRELATIPCSYEDLKNMELVLQLKLAQHPRLVEKLKDTDNMLIVEDCTKRQRGSGLFWGAAHHQTWFDVWPSSGNRYTETVCHWEGDNWLGRLWMQAREAL